MEPVWLDRDAITRAHDEVVALTDGAPGIRDVGLLESALARPENTYAYEGQDDILVLAATYAVGIAKNIHSSTGTSVRPLSACSSFWGGTGFA